MDEHPITRLFLCLAGAALVLLAVADVFMTVLYARVGTGPVSHRLAMATWATARRISRHLGRQKDALLSFFGPLYLVLLIVVWIALLLLGFTLITWPQLGRGVQSQTGPAPTDFATAFYYAGGSMTTVGSGDLRPVSTFMRLLTVIDSIIGLCVMTLTLTYIIQVYTALQRRNALALSLHHASGGTGDAAVLLAGLGPRDDFSHAESQLAGTATETTGVYESHHFYSVLIYFRFQEPFYAMARSTLVLMELLALVDAALDEPKHGWLKRAASVTQLREAGMHVLTELAGVYLPGGAPRTGDQPPTSPTAGDIATAPPPTTSATPASPSPRTSSAAKTATSNCENNGTPTSWPSPTTWNTPRKKSTPRAPTPPKPHTTAKCPPPRSARQDN